MTQGDQGGVDEVRGGRLAVGPRDADQSEVKVVGGIDTASNRPQPGPRLLHDEERQVGGSEELDSGRIGENRDGTAGRGLRRETGAVRRRSGQRGIQIPGSTPRESNVTPLTGVDPDPTT